MKSSATIFSLVAASLFLATALPICAAEEEVPASQTTQAFVEALKPKPVVRTRGMGGVAAAPAPSKTDLEIFFAFNSDRIAGSSIVRTENLAKALQDPQLKDGRFLVVGHTDVIGTREANQQLSQMRADAVRNFLIAHGVPAERLSAEGHGFDQLKNTANPEAEENRRVEIVAKY